MSAVAEVAARGEEHLLDTALDCYKPHCRYLTAATVDVTDDARLRSRAEFAIPESCYIDATGHLNAVEAGICFNQMLYHLIATVVHRGTEPVFATWTPDDFRRRRLGDVLIARFDVAFTRPVVPAAFPGELVVDRIVARAMRRDADPMIAMDTSFRFGDGSCRGRARVAVVGR